MSVGLSANMDIVAHCKGDFQSQGVGSMPVDLRTKPTNNKTLSDTTTATSDKKAVGCKIGKVCDEDLDELYES